MGLIVTVISTCVVNLVALAYFLGDLKARVVRIEAWGDRMGERILDLAGEVAALKAQVSSKS